MFMLTLWKSQIITEKHRQAIHGVGETQEPYQKLTKSLCQSDIEEWTKASERAEFECGNLLDIYQLKMDKGELILKLEFGLILIILQHQP